MDMPLPTSGLMDGKVHLFPIRVNFSDTDAASIVHHSSYFKFAEQARTEMLRFFRIDHSRIEKDFGAVFAIHSLNINYISKARLDDQILISTHLVNLKGASINMKQVFNLISTRYNNSLVAKLDLKVVLVDKQGVLIRMPTELKVIFKELLD